MAMNRQRRTSNISNIFSYDDAGNIVIKDYSQVIRYSWNGTIHGFIGPVSVSSVAAATTDTDKFLVSDGGVLKFRTGAEVLSDIGGQPLLTNPVTGTGVAGQVAYWSGTNSQTGSNNLFWDAANNRLGIGLTNPLYGLDVSSSVRFSNGTAMSTGYSFGVQRLQFNNGVAGGNIGVIKGISDGIIVLSNAAENNFTRLVFGSTTSSFPALQRTGVSLCVVDAGSGTLSNLIVGSFTDGGQRLQVYGDAFIKGSGATSATFALLVQNSSGSRLFDINNSGYYKLSGGYGLFFSQFTTSQGAASINGSNTQFYNYTTTEAATFGAFSFHGDNFIQTSGSVHTLFISKGFYPTSGTATHSTLSITPVINQTGGANGITRGLYVNPNITAAADWRSIEWSNNSGWGLYGAGTADNYLAGKLLINTLSVGTYSLDVNGTARVSGASTFARITATTSGIELDYNSGILYHAGGSGSYYQYIDGVSYTFRSRTATGSLIFATQDIERMRLTSGGNLLVGTTADQGYRVQITGSGDNMLNVWGATTPSIRLDNAASGATQRFVIGLATATNNFIQGANAGDVCLTTASASAMVFGMWQTSSSSEVMRISTSSNVLIGKNTDSGQKLQVVGKVNLTSLPTSATGLVAGDIWNNGGVLNIV